MAGTLPKFGSLEDAYRAYPGVTWALFGPRTGIAQLYGDGSELRATIRLPKVPGAFAPLLRFVR